MKIAVSATGPDLGVTVDPRFGRCQYFLIVDLNDMSFEAVSNEAGVSPSGAGIQSAKLIVDKGAETVLTGNVGPKAYEVLSQADIEVVTGVSGTVREAVQKFKGEGSKPGAKTGSKSASAGETSSFETQPRRSSMVSPNRIGGGRGGGCGRGRGRGMYGGAGGPANPQEEGLSELKDSIRRLTKQVEGMEKRLRGLEKRK
jgi:predicted Fe-Mo cluster-binding NifX family protein